VKRVFITVAQLQRKGIRSTGPSALASGLYPNVVMLLDSYTPALYPSELHSIPSFAALQEARATLSTECRMRGSELRMKLFIKQITACSLTLLLLIPAEARPRSISEQFGRIKPGARIEVTLNGGEVLKGHMGTISSTGFVLDPAKAGKGQSRPLEFQEVKSVYSFQNTGRNVLIVVGIGVAGVVIAVVLIFKFRGFGGTY